LLAAPSHGEAGARAHTGRSRRLARDGGVSLAPHRQHAPLGIAEASDGDVAATWRLARVSPDAAGAPDATARTSGVELRLESTAWPGWTVDTDPWSTRLAPPGSAGALGALELTRVRMKMSESASGAATCDGEDCAASPAGNAEKVAC